MSTTIDNDHDFPPLRREHEQLIREILPLLHKFAAMTEERKLVDDTGDTLIGVLKQMGVPSWQAVPCLAAALIQMCEPNLATSDAKRVRGLTNPSDPPEN